MKGVSPIISFVAVLAVAFTAVSIMSTFGLSQVETLRDTAAIEAMTSTMDEVATEIDTTAALAEDSQSTISIQVDRGSVRYENQSLLYEIRTNSGIISSGVRQQTGNIFLSADARTSLTEDTVDGTQCYRVKNDHISACINAYGGDEDTFTSGSLDSLILEMENRNDGTTIDPTTGVRLNQDTAYNSGEITVVPERTGEYLGEGTVTLYVNPSNRPAYEMDVTLSTGSDFLEMDIQ